MKKNELLEIIISFFNFQKSNTYRKMTKAENCDGGPAFQKLRKTVFRRPFSILNSYSEQKDFINYISSRNMRKTITPSDFKNMLCEPEMDLVNIKHIVDRFSQSLKKSKQLIFFPPAMNILDFHTKSFLLRNLISKESEGNVAESPEENTPESWGGPESFKLIKFLKNDFDDVVNKTSDVIILFYAYWCRHCLRLKPQFGKVALMAKEAGINIMFAAFDVTTNPDLADEKGVVGVPLIKYFKNGQFVATYKGKRTVDDMFDFVKNPPVPPTDVKPPSI